MTTLDRIRAFLADESQFFVKHDVKPEDNYRVNGLNFYGVRKQFRTTSGVTVSIQQSAAHYCNHADQVEVWNCPPNKLLEGYGDGENPYAYVPLAAVAEYIDALESNPGEEGYPK